MGGSEECNLLWFPATLAQCHFSFLRCSISAFTAAFNSPIKLCGSHIHAVIPATAALHHPDVDCRKRAFPKSVTGKEVRPCTAGELTTISRAVRSHLFPTSRCESLFGQKFYSTRSATNTASNKSVVTMIKAIILVVSPRICNLRIEPSVTTASTGPEGYGPPRRTCNSGCKGPYAKKIERQYGTSLSKISSALTKRSVKLRR